MRFDNTEGSLSMVWFFKGLGFSVCVGFFWGGVDGGTWQGGLFGVFFDLLVLSV